MSLCRRYFERPLQQSSEHGCMECNFGEQKKIRRCRQQHSWGCFSSLDLLLYDLKTGTPDCCLPSSSS